MSVSNDFAKSMPKPIPEHDPEVGGQKTEVGETAGWRSKK